MTISRRPNRRASSENAPGPMHRMATAIATASAVAILAGGKSCGRAGKHNRSPPPSTAARGVKYPMSRQPPLASASSIMIQAAGVRLWELMRYAAPWPIKAPPKATRSNSSPTPGRPPGNVENSLCSPLPPGGTGGAFIQYPQQHSNRAAPKNPQGSESFPTTIWVSSTAILCCSPLCSLRPLWLSSRTCHSVFGTWPWSAQCQTL